MSNHVKVLRDLVQKLKQLIENLPNRPSSEYDLHNVIYVYLCTLGYFVEYKGLPGRKNTIDFIINRKIGLEVKYVRTSVDLDKVIGQCLRYKNKFSLEWIILLIYSESRIHMDISDYVSTLKKEGIIPLII